MFTTAKQQDAGRTVTASAPEDAATGWLPISVRYAGIGGVSVLVGATLATRVRLSRRTRSLVQHAAAGIGAGIAAAGALGWLTTQATAALATAVLGLGTSVILSLITEELLGGAIKLTLDRGR